MSEPTTDVASDSSDKVASSPELRELEQAIKAEAGQTEEPETSSEESQVEGVPAMGEAFEKLAQKKGFKSVDDLVKAYENAESRSSKISQELKEIREEIRRVNAPQEDDPYSNLPPEQKEALDLLRRVVQDEVGKSISPIREDLEVKKAGQEIKRVREAFGDVSDDQMESAISIVERNPSLSLEQAVKIVTYDEAKSTGQIKKKRAAQTQEKKRAFVESANTSRTSGDIDYSKLTLEELESIIPANGEFVDSRGVLRR